MLKLKVFYSGLFFIMMSGHAIAENTTESSPEKINSWYLFTFENDVMSLINSSDDGYSNGIAYQWGRSDYNDFSAIDMPNWLHYISDWTYINQGNAKQYSISYGLSQLMYTPKDLSETELIEDDRPYAGTLLWHGKIRSYANNRANSLGLTLGVAGPASLADKSQIFIHEAIDATTPEGWDNQINNELVFRIDGEHIERFYHHSFSDNFSFDTSSYSELGVGNLRTDIGTGLSLRIGNMLDKTYESINPNTSGTMSGMSVTATNKFYWQVFSAAYASYVFNDITLNGNTFTDSHSVELVNGQALISFGASILYGHWGFVFSAQRGSEQFKGQEGISKYGSLTLSYHH